MAPLRPGDPANLGPYEIVSLLGEGGQGTVFLGRRDGAEVAVKLLHARFASDSEARGRFVRELEVAKRVARFCTAQVLDADLDGDRPYIVSEYVTGRSLQDLVVDEGPRTGGVLERLAIGTLTALSAIHQAGIVHRDFKPHNVLLGPDGPRVIDFGIAKALDTTSQSQNVGTPSYMSPEQLAGAQLTPASDMFAWASTMVFAASGQPPFGNDELGAVLYRIAHGEPATGDLPDPLGEVVAACLQKDPALRPTAADAQAVLLGGTAAITAGNVAPVLAPNEMFIHADVDPRLDQRPAENQPVGGMTTYDPIQAHRPGPVKPRKNRNVVMAGAAAAAVLLLSGGAWALLRDTSGNADAAGTVQAGTVAQPGKSTQQPTRKADGSKITSEAGATPTTSSSNGRPTADPTAPGKTNPAATPPAATPGVTPGTSAPVVPAPTPTTTPTPTPTPTSTVAKNPYTAAQVCDTGGHGTGYFVQRAVSFRGGRAVLLYNATGFNCVVTLKTTHIGTKSTVGATLTRQSDGAVKKDRGSYEYYAGPIFIAAPKSCVKFGGGAAPGGSATSGWGNCK